jgi:ATP-dependent DNA helicase RecQ
MRPAEALRASLGRGTADGALFDKPRESHTFDYAVWRFLQVWAKDPHPGPDHAVLLRQVARWHQGRLFAGVLPEELVRYSVQSGVAVSPVGDLVADPFAPSWLKADRFDPEEGIDSRPQPRRCPEELPGEPYVKSVGYHRWHSQAQKEAAWQVLTSPPGTTTLVALPTGSGKSLCFQLLSRFGTGLTIVIVPTIALAIDQWRSAREVLGNIPDLNPHYFASDDRNLNPDTVVSDVREGRTRLVFTSPEACVSGRLRHVLEEAARKHQLENLVVDEAHIIESWGAFFRVDFQMLSTLRRLWLEYSGHSLRTFLLSATFTPHTRAALQKLFGDGGTHWREFVSQRLRPEMTYYLRKFHNEDARTDAVRECAWRLPRPAIFYTTEVDEAKRLYGVLTREEGFRRVGCFHGETRAGDRRSLLARWRSDDIDVMVATSAFGLGVDKSDVRAVVHACMPENMHRYYQEVGRGGRDGASSVSILMPTDKDVEVAGGMAPKLLGEEIAQQRWESLWQTHRPVVVDEHVYEISANARRADLLGTRTWSENVKWNKRLILQLLRAGKLDLLGVDYRKESEEEDATEWLKVRLHFPPVSHLVGTSISEQREEERNVAQSGFRQMLQYLDEGRPICRILKKLYGVGTQRVCGGCPACRREGRKFDSCPKLEFEISQPGNPPRHVVTDVPNPAQPAGAKLLRTRLRRMVEHKRIRRFACAPDRYALLLDVFGEAFNDTDNYLYRLDPLPSEPPFDVRPDEVTAIFHVDQLDREALAFRLGQGVVHLICAGVNYLDVNGRFPGESEGWALHPSLDYWF